ncbi:MAG: nicotinate-nucleotide adenylyltransferase [Dehalococcoidia bacterium]
MKKGILGGTFDPIHNGHLAVAEEARRRLSLDEVTFVPAGCPRLRPAGPLATPEQRVHMVRLAIGGRPYYRLSTVEVERPGPSCSVDTVAEFREQLGEDDELYFILGQDNLAELPRWREPERLVKMCRLVAVPRPGQQLPDLKALRASVRGLAASLILLDAPHIDISASDIRERVSRGLPIRHLIPEAVARYIEERRLYTSRV